MGVDGHEYSRGRTLAADEGVRAVVAFVAMVVVVVAVVVLVVRAAAAAGPGGVASRPRMPRTPRPARGARRRLAPDDDPDFLRELERRTRGDDRPSA
jgi:hypothetical protein